MAKYLNITGVGILWNKIKGLLNSYVIKDGDKVLSTNDYTDADKAKVANTYTKTEINNKVDNLGVRLSDTWDSQLNDAYNTLNNNKVDKVAGKQLSTEDFTTVLKQKLEGLTNYDDATLSTKIDQLKTRLDTLVGSEDATSVIDTFLEIENFLQGVTNTETLTGLLQEMKDDIIALIPTNYVTTNTDQTISGKKKFNSPVVMGTNGVFGTDELQGSMVAFSDSRTVVGSVGDSTTKPTLIRSKTGHVKVSTGNSPESSILDTENIVDEVDKTKVSGLIGKLDVGDTFSDDTDIVTSHSASYSATNPLFYRKKASLLWTYIKNKCSELFTNLSLTGANNNTISVTVGGTTKTCNIYTSPNYGQRLYEKSGDRTSLLLIADVTAWKGGASDKSHYGFVGDIICNRIVGNMIEGVAKVICRVGYADSNNSLNCVLRTSNYDLVRPRIVKYNNNFYLALEFLGGSTIITFTGRFINCLSDFIELLVPSGATLPTGVEDYTSNYTTYDYIVSKVSNADMVDGKHASEFASTAVATTTANGLMSSSDKAKLNNYPTKRVATINLTGSQYDTNTMYPVLFDLAGNSIIEIEIFANTKAIWGTNGNADANGRKNFWMNVKWRTLANGWGARYYKAHDAGVPVVIEAQNKWTTGGDCFGSIGQLTNTSKEYIFLRGGANYNVIISDYINFEVKTESYTVQNETIAPRTISEVKFPTVTYPDSKKFDGYSIDNYQTGGWTRCYPTYYSSGSSLSYYWHKVANISNSGGGQVVLELLVVDDANYPSINSAKLAISNYSNGNTKSVALTQMPNLKNEIRVILGSNGDVWVKFYGIDWVSFAAYRLIYTHTTNNVTTNGITVYTNPEKSSSFPTGSDQIVNSGGIRWLSSSNTFEYSKVNNIASSLNSYTENKDATSDSIAQRTNNGMLNVTGVGIVPFKVAIASAGWYRVYTGATPAIGDCVLLQVGSEWNNNGNENYLFAINFCGDKTASIVQLNGTNLSTRLITKIRVVFSEGNSAAAFIDIYTTRTSSDNIQVSGIGRGKFQNPTAAPTVNTSNVVEYDITSNGLAITAIQNDSIDFNTLTTYTNKASIYYGGSTSNNANKPAGNTGAYVLFNVPASNDYMTQFCIKDSIPYFRQGTNTWKRIATTNTYTSGYVANATTATTATHAIDLKSGTEVYLTKVKFDFLEKAILDNIFIAVVDDSTDLKFVTFDAWKSNSYSVNNTQGIAIVEGDKTLIVYFMEAPVTLKWHSITNGTHAPITGTVTMNKTQAFKDFNGKEKSEVMYGKDTGGTHAFSFCKTVTTLGIPSPTWHVPSLGEMMLIVANKHKIQYLLNLMSGISSSYTITFLNKKYWTSTEGNDTKAWAIETYNDKVTVSLEDKTANFRVLPVATLR